VSHKSFTKRPFLLASSGLIVAAILAAGTIVQASTGSPTVAPSAKTTHTATFSTTPSLAWDLSNCLEGEPLRDEGEPVLDEFGEPMLDEFGEPMFYHGDPVFDENGDPVFEYCYAYAAKNDAYSADMKTGSFTVRTTLSRLPAGWGLCDPESDAHQGWLWTMSGGVSSSVLGSGVEVWSNNTTDRFLVLEGEATWPNGGNVLTRTLYVATPAATSTRAAPLLNGVDVPLCGPDPSTASGQGWRNHRIPEYKLPPIGRWR
jgi:hypothetical protein